ncbi:ferritin-like domain-containing protein [bacterium]|nr:ferritin-like domain-containing protein [candidate division CSSED10-310 bacterium]
MQFDSVEAVIAFAIEREEEAAAFYAELAETVASPHMREVFQSFEREEKKHKAKLININERKLLAGAERRVMNLQLAEYLDDNTAISPHMTYQEALIVAMQREKQSFRLYHDLAGTTDDETLRTALLGLAQEEAKHKLRLELEYDETILTEN